MTHTRILPLALLGWLVAPALAQPALTPEMVARTRLATSVQLSDDGKWACYTLSQPRLLEQAEFEDGPAYVEVHGINAQGGSRPLITQRAGISGLRFSPDQGALTFLSKRDKDKFTSLYRLPMDGGEAQRIYSFGSNLTGYSLSPQGDRLAFLATVPLDPERSRRKKLGFSAEVFEEDWEPVRLYLARPGASSEGLQPVEGLPGSLGEVHWSPDGSRLAVTLAPNPGVDADLMYRRIHLLDARTGKSQVAIKNPGKLGQLAFSPDGKHLSLLTGEDLNDPDNGRLWVADCATGATRDLWPGLAARVTKVDWVGPQRLRALVWKGLVSEVWELGLDGSKSLVVAAGEEIITDLAVSGNGQRSLYLSESPKHPGEVFWQESRQAPRRVTRLNPELELLGWARQEAFTYKARDGQEIEGVLIHPREAQAGQRYPLIMWVHGGPESLVHNGWLNYYSMPGQVAAARGYAVFYPNYRGSIGRSVAFSKLGQKDPAGREFEDLIDGVDALVARGLVDPKKVGVTGGSYGGYATAWCSTYFSDRFAAGVMSVGISNKISKSGTTDIPDEEYLVHARQRPWEAWSFLLERSPIQHVLKHRTPLLILHGKEDPRVHPAQSLEMYRYLKMAGQAPVRLVLYPGEGHGNRKAVARYDYQLRMLEWMDHYLKGPGGEPPSWDLRPPLPGKTRSGSTEL